MIRYLICLKSQNITVSVSTGNSIDYTNITVSKSFPLEKEHYNWEGRHYDELFLVITILPTTTLRLYRDLVAFVT